MTITANDHPYRVTAVEGSAKYANNHPIKVEIEGGVVTPDEFEELKKKVDALATDLSYKGGVPTYDDLPVDPEQGDVYTVEDTGVLYVWDGDEWVALNDSKKAITGSADPTSSTEGELGQLYLNTTSGELFYCSATGDTYTWVSLDSPIQSISVNGTAVTPDVNKNVALTIPTVNDATLTITQNGTSAGTFTANASTDATIALTDTTYSNFVGTDGTAAGTAGLVPAPATTDAGKFLKADGTWGEVGGGANTFYVHTRYSLTVDEKPSEIKAAFDAGKTIVLIHHNIDNRVAYLGVLRMGTSFTSAVTSLSGYVFGGNSTYEIRKIDLAFNWNADTTSCDVSEVMTGIQTDLSSTSNRIPLAASQGKVLKDLIDSLVIKNAGAPTTSTVGTVGMLYEDTTNGKLYQLTAIDNTDPQNIVYTWTEVGGGGSGPTVVQTTGTSTTDVMSQNAVTGMVFGDPSNRLRIAIGNGASATVNYAACMGRDSIANANRALALGGDNAKARHAYSVALGSDTTTTAVGQVQIGCNSATGYNNSNYRLLTGLYDGQSAHDAATVAQGNTLSTSAPTTTTEGVLGQLYTDTTNMHTYQCTAIDTTDPQSPIYTWTQRW